MSKKEEILWSPSENFIKDSLMAKYIEWLREKKELKFELSYDKPLENIKNYNELWKWSVENLEEFWKSIWEFFQIKSYSGYEKILTSRSMPGARWFTNSTLNFAEHMLRNARIGEDSIIYVREDGFRRSLKWEDLIAQTASLASWFEQNGIKESDVIAAYTSQLPEAVIALLATSSIGAIWAIVGLEIAARAAIDRFKGLNPKILIASDGYIYNGKAINKLEDVQKVAESIPSIEKIIFIPSLDEKSQLKTSKKVINWAEATEKKEKLRYKPLEFNHPLWVLYTSGTTGIPKPVVQSHGGILIEFLKGRLHIDTKSEDKFFWYSTPTWMMWNVVVGALGSGSTIVFYDGSPMHKGLLPLWELAEKEGLTVFGTSAPFIHACMKIGIEPGYQFNLKKIREIGSTAAPLSPQGFKWIYQKVKEDVWLNSASGGTDVCSGFVGGNPLLPVYVGEMQSRWLGVKVEAYSIEGKPVINEVGELVIELPMPSMPIYLWGDKDYTWYKEAYFSMFPQVWWHGDWILITDRGTAIILGRSDSTIKRKGIRMGTLDIYKVVESLPEIQNSLAIEVKGKIVLYVVLKPGYILDDALKQKIKDKMKEELGPYFIADYIIQVQDIPMTLNFKKLEVPVKKIILGWELSKAVNLDSLLNPDALFKLIDATKPYLSDILKED